MDDSLVSRARALADAATPGPWTVDEEGWIDEQPTALLIYGAVHEGQSLNTVVLSSETTDKALKNVKRLPHLSPSLAL